MADQRALVVDDSPTMRQLIIFALQRVDGLTGWDEAENGLEALKLLSHTKYSVVLSDVNMPLMDGFTLLQRIREDLELVDMPVVMITTEGKDADRDRAMELGANAYITKPVKSAELISAVSMLLES